MFKNLPIKDFYLFDEKDQLWVDEVLKKGYEIMIKDLLLYIKFF